MRRPLIAGNWKMHKTLTDARQLVRGIKEGLARRAEAPPPEILICPPFPLLHPLREEIAGSTLLLGAQNAHGDPHGAFTGETSVPMLADAGCSHVIVGHSERRHLFHEDHPMLFKKVRAVIGAGLTAIYCVGETLEQREAGQTEAVIRRQVGDVLTTDLLWTGMVIAYEPVWAIGTGRTASPGQAQEVHAFIRSELSKLAGAAPAAEVRILYGGSVKASNAAGLMAQADIDGALVGGASLAAEEFLGIIAAAESAAR